MSFSEEFSSFAEGFVPLTPINFFQISAGCLYLPPAKGTIFPNISKVQAQKMLLPDLSKLCAEESFAEISLGWNEEGLEALVKINRPFKRSVFPDVDRGDSVEFFIDTRDVKTAGFNTRFCHHFFFLPEAVDGHSAGEITHFRTEDAHPLCDSKDLKVKSSLQSSSYSLHIFIPESCLYGFDPGQFKRLGFSYRINRADGFPQHFSVVTEDFSINQQPSLWGSLKLLPKA